MATKIIVKFEALRRIFHEKFCKRENRKRNHFQLVPLFPVVFSVTKSPLNFQSVSNVDSAKLLLVSNHSRTIIKLMFLFSCLKERKTR